jgi:hypothetical protein
MPKPYRHRLRVWKWPGAMGWHMVTLPKDTSRRIRTTYGKGLIPVALSIGSTNWDTSLLPHTASDAYLIALKKSIRYECGILTGDTITLSITIKKALPK